MVKSRHFISVSNLSAAETSNLVIKAAGEKGKKFPQVLSGKFVSLLFEKPSLRTRVSFEVAVTQLGGHCIYLSPEEVGLGKREPVEDVAQVLGRYVDCIVARTFAHSSVEELAQYATVPVINGLSDLEHPCQTVADILTILEKKGKLEGLSVAYIGDGNNVAASLLLACALIRMEFRFASPRGYEIPEKILQRAKDISFDNYQIIATESPENAVSGADVVYTDVWTSMGQEAESEQRRKEFASFTITSELLAKAKPDAILMHPMPVHHGEEFAEGIIDCPQSVLIDQAENRLHAQKAILVELAKQQ